MYDMINIMDAIANTVETMPYREKTAWLALAALGLPYSVYFVWVIVHPPRAPMPDWDSWIVFGVALSVSVLIWVGGAVWLRRGAPDEARAPLDERDLAISRRSIQTGYSILVSGLVINIGCVFPFTTGGWKLINSGIAMLVLAELVRYSMAVWLYRRGGHV